MPISVAIIGASGSVGSALAAHILRSEVLEASDRVQLVGHGASKSEKMLLAERVDLLDAFDDGRVEVEMVPNIADVDADIVIITAGVGFSAQCSNRREMGVINRELFEKMADECARQIPDALVIIVSNPVELAVRIFAERLDRGHVFGMGSQQDSLRFARAIAKDLGVSRHEVRASVLGEHGQAMVPLWSSVEVLAPNHDYQSSLEELKERSLETPLHERVVALRSEVGEYLKAERVPEAYEVARRALPDARVFIEPFITATCMHSTPNATANATLQCLAATLAGDGRRIHCQVLLEGEALDLYGVCGIPLTVSRNGWHRELIDGLTPTEMEAIVSASESINEYAAEVLGSPAAN